MANISNINIRDIIIRNNACTQAAIRFFTVKYEILEFCTQTTIRFFTVKYKILRLYPNGHLFFTAKYEI